MEPKGKDNYGRTLAYVFGKDNQGNKILYEASVTELGYARPLFYSENYVTNYGEQIINAYRRAYESKKGIFSKWETAPKITKTSAWSNYVGKIIWLEMDVSNVYKSSSVWYIVSDFAVVKIRDEEYSRIFGGYNLYSLTGKRVKFYGELWNDGGKPTIMLRAPWEIVLLN
ncbi:MAG: thermonuclease family protein [Fervidobacterium sp.]